MTDIDKGAKGLAKGLTDETSDALWGLVREYLEQHGDADGLALKLLAAGIELADKQSGQHEQNELNEQDKQREVAKAAEPQRQLRQGREPLSQEAILREVIRMNPEDQAAAARLEEFIAKYLRD